MIVMKMIKNIKVNENRIDNDSNNDNEDNNENDDIDDHKKDYDVYEGKYTGAELLSQGNGKQGVRLLSEKIEQSGLMAIL